MKMNNIAHSGGNFVIKRIQGLHDVGRTPVGRYHVIIPFRVINIGHVKPFRGFQAASEPACQFTYDHILCPAFRKTRRIHQLFHHAALQQVARPSAR